MANPPFSTDPLDLPIDAADYVDNIQDNFSRCETEIIDLNNRLQAQTGLVGSQHLALSGDVYEQGLTAPIVFLIDDGLGPWTIKGFTRRDDFRVTLVNKSADYVILGHDNNDASAENRVLIDQGLDFYLPPGESVEMIYDTVDERWRMQVRGRPQKIVRVITTAELNAFGGVTSEEVSFPRDLPEQAVPQFLRARNGGTAFTSSGGSITDLSLQFMASGAAEQFDDLIQSLFVSDSRGQIAIQRNSIVFPATADYPFEVGPWTPALEVAVDGSGVTLGNLEDGDDDLIAELFYTA